MNWELLEELSWLPGVSGFEQAAQARVAELLRPSVDSLFRDRIGNVIGIKKATRPVSGERAPRVVLAAHVDEYGYWVSDIDDKGFVTLSMHSGALPAAMMGLQVIFHAGTDKEVIGVIAPKHTKDELKYADLRLDTGRDADWVKERLAIGDIGVPNIPLSKLNDKTICSRNFDNRLGLYCMLEAATRIGDLGVDLYLVSTVQEEVGIRGMPSAVNNIEPDVGLAIDGGVTRDAYNGPPSHHCVMGGGTSVYVHDRMTLGDGELLTFLYDVCESNGIAWQKNYGGGTDASSIQRHGKGALATTVGAPVRYMHTGCQLANVDDVEATVEMLAKFAESAEKIARIEPWQAI